MDNDATALKKVFIEAVINRGREFAAKRKEVQGNGKLTESGKADEIVKINAEAREALDALTTRFKAEHNKARETYARTLDPPKQRRSAIDRIRGKGEYESIDDRDKVLAGVESNEAVIRALEKSTFMNAAHRLDQKELLGAIDRYLEAGNLAALENLSEVATFRGDQPVTQKISAAISHVQEQQLSPQQKIAKLEIERLGVHEAIFENAVQRAIDGKGLDLLEAMALPGQSDEKIDFQIQAIKASTVNKKS